MAEEEQTVVEGAGEQAPAKGGGKKKIMLLGIVGVAAIVLGVAVALFVVKPMMSDAPDGAEHATEQKESHGEESGGQGEEGKTGSILYAIDDIIVNPAGTGGTRFLSVSIGIELGNSKLAQQVESREPMVRDALITILASKTVAQLTDAKQKEITRYQIKKRLEGLLATDQVKGVYYTDFVLQ